MDVETTLDADGDDLDNDIAVIGMAGRFPGASDIDAFWRNICDGVESVTPLPAGGPPATSLLDGVDLFDASFFGYSARDAEILDPQQRLLLECAWHAVESAGHDPTGFAGPVGVFCGVGIPTYLLFHLMRAPRRVDLAADGMSVMMGNDKGFASTRIAYHLNLRGPSVDVNSACSTSLVSVVMACESLLSHQCDMALAGGAAINVAPEQGHRHHEGGPVSADGHCRAFDARAGGTVFGSGVGVVVLKRLSDALADGDRIRAVIKGAAVNNDGSLKVGFAAPSVDGQAEVISRALAMAGVGAGSVGYVEAHGTGTRLGDPIEVAALTRAFRESASGVGFCAVGSVKTNVGHLDAAAGVAGLIKAVLMVERGKLPPSLHFVQPNPEIDFAGSPFYVNTELREWRGGDTPRRAGISSFGFGGTNAHVIIEQPPEPRDVPMSHGTHVLTLSARTPAALDQAARRLAAHLEEHPQIDLGDVAHTLRIGRRHFEYRRAAIAGTPQEAASRLLDGTHSVNRVVESPSVAFLLPGQGSQYPGMARQIHEQLPHARDIVDECARLLRPRLGIDLRDALWPTAAGGRREFDVNRTALAQPALFTIEFAMAETLREWGIQPQAILGHSVGEYVAACLAGVFSLEDALTVVAERGALMQATRRGAMVAVDLDEDAVADHLSDGVVVAAVNSPGQRVLAGGPEAIARTEAALAAAGVPHRRLRTSHAFHSPLMDHALEPFRAVLEKVTLHAPRVPFVSNVTGTWITADEARDPDYWTRHLRDVVRFDAGLRTLLATPDRLLLEVGPGQSLSTLARHHPDRTPGQAVVATGSRTRGAGRDHEALLNGVGRIWMAGARVELAALATPGPRRRVPLPTYPFQHERYWIAPQVAGESSAESPAAPGTVPVHVPTWRRSPAFLCPPAGTGSASDRSWLVLSDGGPTANRLVALLRERAESVTVVASGERFEQVEAARYRVRPTEPADYRELLARMGRWPTDIVHLWAMRPAEPSDQTAFEDAQERGLYSVLAFARAVGERTDRPGMTLTVVTSAVQAVTGDEALLPDRATVLGACRVIPQELVGLRCRSVDVPMCAGVDPDAALADRLLAEVDAGMLSETTVAYRGSQRWVADFAQVTLPDEPPALRENGVFVVTGGFGRIGLALARHLARNARARLVLIGRTKLPRFAEWDAWLSAHDEHDPVSLRIRAVRELHDAGAEVLAVDADVTDRGQLAEALRQARTRFGRIDGVVHAAGQQDTEVFAPIADLDRRRCAEVLRTKVLPLPILDELLREDAADFRVLQSSLATLLGGPGLAAYAAANSYLDAFAWQRHAAGDPRWVSVDWDVWRTAADSGASGERQLDDETAARIFQHLAAARDATQFVVAAGDLRTRIDTWQTAPERAAEADQAPAHPRPELPQPYVAADSAWERLIAGIWQELLRVAPVGVHDDFFALGGDSILATRLVVRLRAEVGREIPLDALFESPTIHGIASALASVEPAPDLREPALAPVPRAERRPRRSVLSDVKPGYSAREEGC